MPYDLQSAIKDRLLLTMRSVAEALAMPERLCLKRACRREHACLYIRGDMPEPMCLTRLWPWERAMFDEVLRAVADIHDGAGPQRPSDDPARRALDEAAGDIVRAIIGEMPDIAPRFAAWRASYQAAETGAADPQAVVRAGGCYADAGRG